MKKAAKKPAKPVKKASVKKLSKLEKAAGAAPARHVKTLKARPDDQVTAKKAADISKKLAKQRKIIAQAEAPSAEVKSETRPPEKEMPRIECRLVYGDHSVEVDAVRLERTLGICEFAGRGLIDQWPDAVWTALLHHLDLPAFPLDREVAIQPVRRLVQRLWYEAIKGGIPEESRKTFETRDAARSAAYVEDFKRVETTSTERSERAKTNLGNLHRTSAVAGRKIKVLNAKHGAREGTKRQIGLDIILKAKTTDEALPLLQKAGCNATFISFAVSAGFVELV